MKQYILSLVTLLLISASAFSQSEISFETKSHDFEEIAAEVPASYEFKFTNEGTAPLIISGAEGSCGCTVPKYPKEPIMPGKSGVILVTYDAKKPGPFQKSVTIDSNDPNSPTDLRIKGTVIGAEK